MSPSYACSLASTERDEPMFATGSSVRGWVLVEVPGAWGRTRSTPAPSASLLRSIGRTT